MHWVMENEKLCFFYRYFDAEIGSSDLCTHIPLLQPTFIKFMPKLFHISYN